MKVRILSRTRKNYSNRRFREEGKKLGLVVHSADPNEYEIVLGRKTPLLFYRGKIMNEVDVVLPRSGASITNYGLAVIAQFEMRGTPVVNGSTAITHTRNKLRCLQLMTRYDIDIPRTVIIRRPDELEGAVRMVGGFPVILKLISGTQGIGVMLAEKMQTIESTIDTLWSLGQDILIQECVKESVGRDIRVIVVGGRVVAAMRRQARIGEFRSNIHRGGIGTTAKLTDPYERAAKQAARIVGLDVAGVDLLESYSGPKVIEVNSSPGLEGVEAATGVNVARAILEHVAEIAERKSSKRARQRLL
ncbi:MAG: RimK family alpha-L-glutamate ligase [Pseudomonadota bacterium]